MDFYVDLAIAVILRLLKDKRQVTKYQWALRKVYDAIGLLLIQNHVGPTPDEFVKLK